MFPSRIYFMCHPQTLQKNTLEHGSSPYEFIFLFTSHSLTAGRYLLQTCFAHKVEHFLINLIYM